MKHHPAVVLKLSRSHSDGPPAQRWHTFALALALLLGAATTSGAEQGKFHLVYRVIAPKVEQGAQVEVEPALITDGDWLVFAYDYCRHHYPQQNYSAGRDKHEQRIEKKEITSEDQITLERYCERAPFTLKGNEFSVLDNARVRLSLSDPVYDGSP
ncbi:MAG: hypothetical protein ACREXR_17265, partial [Gammaproteobacteria bacterium]